MHLINLRNKNEVDCETRLNLVLKLADLGYWDMDPDQEYFNWSPKAKSFFGLSSNADVTYDLFLSAVHPDDRERVEQTIKDALSVDVGHYCMEFRTIGVEDGKERIVSAAGSVKFDHNQRPILIVGVSSDITSMRNYERGLREAKESADIANKAKTEFLANVSHEIRTPVGAILGFSELALEPKYSTSQLLEFIEKIHSNGELLNSLIEQVLDLSKIEANNINIDKKKVPFAATLEQVVANLRLKADQKNISLILEYGEQLPEWLETDPMRFEQILNNIVGNAIKFTEKGQVTVSAKNVPLLTGKPSRIAISVTDTGIGISTEERKKLFKRFSQADPSNIREFGGTGIGLALSKDLALALGGDLVLSECMKGLGSTFILILPAVINQKTQIEAPATAPSNQPNTECLILAGLKVLVVDDSEDNQEILVEFLRSAGASVETAANGHEAITKALKGIFDIVLMDLQMPVVDGVTATKELRAHGFKKPILALTANALPKDRRQSRAEGFNDHITKPIRARSLIKAVAEHTHRNCHFH